MTAPQMKQNQTHLNPLQTFQSVSWQDVTEHSQGFRKASTPRDFHRMLQFVSQPLQWEASEQNAIEEKRLPITRRLAEVSRLLDVFKETKVTVWLTGITLALVATLLYFGITKEFTPQAVKAPEEASLLATHLPNEGENPANAFLSVASEVNQKMKKTAPKDLNFRTDPFKPLVQMQWLEKLKSEEENPSYRPSETEAPAPSVNPFPNQNTPAVNSIQASSFMEFVGVISDENPKKPATVLLKLLGDSGGQIVSKRLGTSFEFGGNYITLTALRGATLYLVINGFKDALTLSSTQGTTSSSSTNTTSTKEQTPSEVEKILQELGRV
jgi:hypothetical protein